MPGTATVKLSADVENLTIGSLLPDLITSLSAAVGDVMVVGLTAGNNTVNVPTGTTLAIIVPDPATVAALVLKGAAGDTGIPWQKTGWGVLALDPTATSFVINASQTASVTVVFL